MTVDVSLGETALAARRAMIDSQLRPEGVNDPRVLAAMAAVAREAFVPAAAAGAAYHDRSVALDGGAALMAPVAIGRLLQALEIVAGERVLLVSRAPGYAAGLLRALGARVEVVSDADAGNAVGPYEAILIDGAVEALDPALARALVAGGRLAGGLVERGLTRLVLARRAGEGTDLAVLRLADAELPRLAAFARPPAFTF